MKTNGGTKTQIHGGAWIEKAWPEVGGVYTELRGKALGGGALDARTKAFIQLVLLCKVCVL